MDNQLDPDAERERLERKARKKAKRKRKKRSDHLVRRVTAVGRLLAGALAASAVGVMIVGYFLGFYTDPENAARQDAARELALVAIAIAIILSFASENEK